MIDIEDNIQLTTGEKSMRHFTAVTAFPFFPFFLTGGLDLGGGKIVGDTLFQ